MFTLMLASDVYLDAYFFHLDPRKIESERLINRSTGIAISS